MTYQIGDWVVYPAFGVGRITGQMAKSLYEGESRLYYEVTGAGGTVWVLADEAAASGLRHLTRPGRSGSCQNVRTKREFRQDNLALQRNALMPHRIPVFGCG